MLTEAKSVFLLIPEGQLKTDRLRVTVTIRAGRFTSSPLSFIRLFAPFVKRTAYTEVPGRIFNVYFR